MEIVEVEVYKLHKLWGGRGPRRVGWVGVVSIENQGKPRSDKRGVGGIVGLLRPKKNKLKSTSNGVEGRHDSDPVLGLSV